MSEVDLKPAAADQSGDFSSEQKRYLEGFVAGVQIAKAAKSVAGVPASTGSAAPAPEPTGPDAAAFKAQNRVLAAGKKLSDQEKFKREEHPFDSYERLKELGARRISEAARQFPLAVLRLVLCRAEPEFVYVPLAYPERHPQSGAVRRRRRSRRALWRRLRPRHHAGQSTDPRDRSA
jgi:hypothetical protein